MKMLRFTPLRLRASFLVALFFSAIQLLNLSRLRRGYGAAGNFPRGLFLLLFLSTISYQPSAFPQGSLTPPGPPAPTMKTLEQVEARTPVDAIHTPGDATTMFFVSQPGSYYLTANVNGVSGKNGIVITTDNVVLDLNGFNVIGPGSTGTGVDCGSQKNIVVRNGVIRSWLTGLNATGSGGRLRVEKIRAISNAGTGIFLSTNNCVVVDCLADSNTTTGILTGANCLIQNCEALGNSNSGISTGSNCIINGCHVAGNGTGMSIGGSVFVTGCQIDSNVGTGIIANANCRLKDSTIATNIGKGIDTVTAGGVGTLIQNCLVTGNIGVPIDLSGSCIVRDCIIQPSGSADGINMGTVNGSWISNNQIRNAGPGHNGITCAGNNNRIDGNTFTSNNVALSMSSGSNNNLVIRNVFLNNTTNYSNNGGTQKDAQIANFGTGQVSTDPWENIR